MDPDARIEDEQLPQHCLEPLIEGLFGSGQWPSRGDSSPARILK
jgi:hypothetical protein